MKSNYCFNCLYHGEGSLVRPPEKVGWYHPCECGIANEGFTKEDVEACRNYEPNEGFQIGGYYTHMHFDYDDNDGSDPDYVQKPNTCMEWHIHGDGDYPTRDMDKWIAFHICDFRQIEEWVKFWGKYLREKGVVTDEE